MSDDIISKTRQDYNLIARYFSDSRYDVWPELKQFEQYVKPGQRVLDWGCGNGRLLLMLKDKSINYTGLDQSDELIKIAKEKYKKDIQDGWVNFYCTATEETNFSDEYFDLVFLIASFHHLPDEESRVRLLKKIYMETKTGGRLIMTNWNLESVWAENKIKNKEWTQMGERDFLIPWRNSQREILCERYYHSFMEMELNELLQKAGWSVELHNDLDPRSRSGMTGGHEDDDGGRNLTTIAIKKVRT